MYMFRYFQPVAIIPRTKTSLTCLSLMTLLSVAGCGSSKPPPARPHVMVAPPAKDSMDGAVPKDPPYSPPNLGPLPPQPPVSKEPTFYLNGPPSGLPIHKAGPPRVKPRLPAALPAPSAPAPVPSLQASSPPASPPDNPAPSGSGVPTPTG